GESRADAGEDGVAAMTQLLHVRSRDLAGDPAAVVVRRGDLPVQGERGFESDQRNACLHVVDEGFVELARRRRSLIVNLDLDSGLAQLAKTFTGDQRVG